MSGVVRRAGRAILRDGTELVWSVADGRRGRRWRAMTIRDGHLAESLLLEVDNDGRPARLELTTAAGLLTLHPEASGSLHGNAVTPAGVRHLAFAWSGDHELTIDRLPVVAAVTARRRARTIPVGEGTDVAVVIVAPDLEVQAGVRRYDRVAEATWRIEGGRDGTQTLTIDDRGLPVGRGARGETVGAWDSVGPGEPTEWPLELESQR